MESNRDIVVVGASLGGIAALGELAAALPADLPAAVLVVQHTAPASPGALADILAARGSLPSVTATDGMRAERGRIHVAPPDRHLLLMRDERLRVTFGPRENRSRPAIDPLFRTAAVHYRSRVVGVVLTGLLRDGAAGLLAVHRCGGRAAVQDPRDAAFPDMPSRALDLVPGTERVALGDLATRLDRWTREPAPPPPPIPDDVGAETELMERAMTNATWNEPPRPPTRFTCPECHGALQQIVSEPSNRFRCRLGHTYSKDAMLAAKDESVERSMWVAIETLEERADLLETMAADSARRGHPRSAEDLSARAQETRQHVEVLRRLMNRIGG